MVGWVQRFQKFREWRRKKPHTPGVWVLYFALAAIPLFALGQAMIPAEDAERRAATFWQMAVYVGSALGLLVTTTLMGLKRYLEDRKATIPTAMTAAWLGLGLLLIVAFIGVAAVLPRPHSETPLFAKQEGGKLDRKASKNAVVKDNSAGQGGRRRRPAEGEWRRQEPGEGRQARRQGRGAGAGAGRQQRRQPERRQQGRPEGRQGRGRQQGERGEGGRRQERKAGRPEGERPEGRQGRPGEQSDKGEDGDKAEGKSDGEGDDGDGTDGEQGSNALEKMGQGFEVVGEVVKWIVWIVLAGAVIGGGGYFLLKYLGNFTGWAKGLLDWFRGLSQEGGDGKGGRRRGRRGGGVGTPAAVQRVRQTRSPTGRPSSGRPASWPSTRSPRSTPGRGPRRRAHARRNAERVRRPHRRGLPRPDEPGKALAELYVMAMYSKKDLPADAKKTLAAFWVALDGEPAVR